MNNDALEMFFARASLTKDTLKTHVPDDGRVILESTSLNTRMYVLQTRRNRLDYGRVIALRASAPPLSRPVAPPRSRSYHRARIVRRGSCVTRRTYVCTYRHIRTRMYIYMYVRRGVRRIRREICLLRLSGVNVAPQKNRLSSR